ncbi:MAG: DUF4365 domain-containing protein [Rhodoglobus sp.]
MDGEGVVAVEVKVVRDVGWIFRKQPTSDYGIDSQLEFVESSLETGKPVTVQIESGPSCFQKTHEDGGSAVDPVASPAGRLRFPVGPRQRKIPRMDAINWRLEPGRDLHARRLVTNGIEDRLGP